MKVVALVSGGKDSCYNMIQCVHAGHNIVALANLHPPPKTKDEMDSYMYQTVGHATLSLYAEALGLPLYRACIQGTAAHNQQLYSPTEGDEVEDLYRLLKRVKEEVDCDAVSSGAILSDYQRLRVENVCGRLGLTSLSFLWRRNQRELLQEMVDCGVHAVLIKVAALGLMPDKHLGRTLAEIQPHMRSMAEKYGLNECGEGGEYETFTLDCPLFKKKIVVDEQEVVEHSRDAFAPVAYLRFTQAHLEDKGLGDRTQPELIAGLPLPPQAAVLLPNPAPPTGPVPDCDLDRLTLDVSADAVTEPTVVETGGWVWVGQIDGRPTEGKSAMVAALDQLKAALAARHLSAADLCAVSLYVRRMSQYAALNADYVAAVGGARPARLCVEAPLPAGVQVRLDAAALRPTAAHRRDLHVQSVSHWAPANIGPYSQAVQCGEVVYVAGMIGLDPAGMRLVAGGEAQARLALRHVERVLAAACRGADNSWVAQVVCYVADAALVSPCGALAAEAFPEALSCCVVVPGLPRGASVEWHVWAHAANAQFDTRSSSLQMEGATLQVALRWSSRHRSAAAAVLCACDAAPGARQLAACARATVSCLRGRAGGAAVCQLRLFHRPENAAAAAEAAAAVAGTSCAVTCVPVTAVEDGSHQLAAVGVALDTQRPKKD